MKSVLMLFVKIIVSGFYLTQAAEPSSSISKDGKERNDAILFHLGQEHGFHTSKEEILVRQRIESCTGNNLSIDEVESKIIEEKFICSLSKQEPDYSWKIYMYDSLFRSDGQCGIKFEEANDYIDYLYKVSLPETYFKILNCIEQFKNKQTENNLAAGTSSTLQNDLPLYRQFWNKKEFLLTGNDDDCIAYDTIRNKCIVSLIEYNQFINQSIEESKCVSRDSVIEHIKNQLLENKYLLSKAIESGFVDLFYVKSRIMELYSQGVSACRAEKARDESYLKSVYAQLYNDKYAPKKVCTIDIIGSTDSTYIDSLHKLYTNSYDNRFVTSNKLILKNKKYPWKNIDAANLPQVLLKKIETLPLGEISPVIKVSFGYFIIRKITSFVTRKISFEDARDEISTMVTYGQAVLKKEILLKETKNYYYLNRQLFKAKDTLLLQYALLSDTTYSYNNPEQKICYITINSDSLPDIIQSALKKNCNSGSLYQGYVTFPTDLGFCTVKIIDLRLGNAIRQFSEAKDEIISELSNTVIDPDCIPADAFTDAKCTRLITSLYMDYLSKDTEKVDSAYTIEFSQASILENNIEPGMDEREQEKLYNFPGYQHAQKEMLEWQKNIVWNKYIVW